MAEHICQGHDAKELRQTQIYIGKETGNGIYSVLSLTYMASWRDKMYQDAADSANLRHSAPSCSPERVADVAEL